MNRHRAGGDAARRDHDWHLCHDFIVEFDRGLRLRGGVEPGPLDSKREFHRQADDRTLGTRGIAEDREIGDAATTADIDHHQLHAVGDSRRRRILCQPSPRPPLAVGDDPDAPRAARWPGDRLGEAGGQVGGAGIGLECVDLRSQPLAIAHSCAVEHLRLHAGPNQGYEVGRSEAARGRPHGLAHPVDRRRAIRDEPRGHAGIHDEHHVTAAATEEPAEPFQHGPGEGPHQREHHRRAKQHQQPLHQPYPPPLLNVALHQEAKGRQVDLPQAVQVEEVQQHRQHGEREKPEEQRIEHGSVWRRRQGGVSPSCGCASRGRMPGVPRRADRSE